MTDPGAVMPNGQTDKADPTSKPTAFGTPDLYRENIAQVLAGAEIYARIGRQYVEVADNGGIDHAVRCLVAHTRSAVNLLRHLHELEEIQAKRRSERSGGQRS